MVGTLDLTTSNEAHVMAYLKRQVRKMKNKAIYYLVLLSDIFSLLFLRWHQSRFPVHLSASPSQIQN